MSDSKHTEKKKESAGRSQVSIKLKKKKRKAENWQQKTLPVIPKLDNWPRQVPGTTSEISADAWSRGASGWGPGELRGHGDADKSDGSCSPTGRVRRRRNGCSALPFGRES